MITTKLEYHPLAMMFPRPSHEQKQALFCDMQKHGLINPILIYEGKILDGITRYQICTELAIEPIFTEDMKGMSPIDIVTSLNLTRRHLTTGQIAALGADLMEVKAKEWKERLKEKRGFTPIRGHNNGNRNIETLSKDLNIGATSLARAIYVRKRDPYLFNELKEGKMTVRSAYKKAHPVQAIRNEITDRLRMDKVAREIIDNVDIDEFQGVPNVFASDYEIWTFDKYMKRKGFNLSLVRVGDNFDAIYKKDNSHKINGFCNNFKVAIISAGKEALQKELLMPIVR